MDSQAPYSKSPQPPSSSPARRGRRPQRERRPNSGLFGWLNSRSSSSPRRRTQRGGGGSSGASMGAPPTSRRGASRISSHPSVQPLSSVQPLRKSTTTRSREIRRDGRRDSTRRRSQAAPIWPPRSQKTLPLPKMPKAPAPVIYGVRFAMIGIGVAALAGTLLSVLSPTEADPGKVNSARTASRTESAITAQEEPREEASILGLTQEVISLESQLIELQELTPGLTPSIFILDLDTGKYVDIEGQKSIAAASTIKLPILVAFFQEVDAGRIAVEQMMVMRPEQIVGGSGRMQGQAPGTKYTALEVATQMIINSDNTATNMMIDLLGGAEALNTRFAEWELSGTVLNNPLPDLEGTNTTTTQDLVTMMAFLHQGELLSLRSRDRVLNILQRTYNKNLLPSALAEGTVTYNKTGDIGEVLGDVALIDVANGKRYAIATLVQRPNNDGRARELIRRISQQVYQDIERAIVPSIAPGSDAIEPGLTPATEGAPGPNSAQNPSVP